MINTCEAGNLTLAERCSDPACICNTPTWPASTIMRIAATAFDADAFGTIIVENRYLPYAAG